MYSLMVTIFILQNTAIQAVRVIGGNVTVVQGNTAVLPCLLTESTESLTQITWQRRTRLINTDTNFFTILIENGPEYFNGKDKRFSFVGNKLQGNGSLQLSNVTKSDEGTYTCIYTLFPSGNVKTEIPLNVLVPPENSLKDEFLIVGNEEVVLATCIAARSWPSSNVGWDLGELSDLLRIAQKITENADGTFTTVSILLGAPTRNLHNHSVTCVIKSPALPEGTTLPLTIQVHFPPSEVRIKELPRKGTSKPSFECVSEANPKASVTWSRSSLPWPDSGVKVNGAELHILRPSPQLNGLFECKANNTYGTAQGHLYLHLSDEGTCVPAWVLFSLLLLGIVVAAAAVWFYRSDQKCNIPWFNRRGQPVRTEGSEEQEPQLSAVAVDVV
ncbi:nectin-3 [Eucyclogobius newberryi]|uniref:nectin-3 n=1 Tax=Eucyclogobius newberryi TaxID=166745 RepID=UPI003B5ADF6D